MGTVTMTSAGTCARTGATASAGTPGWTACTQGAATAASTQTSPGHSATAPASSMDTVLKVTLWVTLSNCNFVFPLHTGTAVNMSSSCHGECYNSYQSSQELYWHAHYTCPAPASCVPVLHMCQGVSWCGDDHLECSDSLRCIQRKFYFSYYNL